MRMSLSRRCSAVRLAAPCFPGDYTERRRTLLSCNVNAEGYTRVLDPVTPTLCVSHNDTVRVQMMCAYCNRILKRPNKFALFFRTLNFRDRSPNSPFASHLFATRLFSSWNPPPRIARRRHHNGERDWGFFIIHYSSKCIIPHQRHVWNLGGIPGFLSPPELPPVNFGDSSGSPPDHDLLAMSSSWRSSWVP